MIGGSWVISNRFIWKCPTRYLLDHFNHHVTANHLDVGVGTGYFLDHAQFPSQAPRLALLDLNSTCLELTAKRVTRYAPISYQANILEPLNLETSTFDSISLNYVLHCLPGTLELKTNAFDHLKNMLNPGGVVFGGTLLMESTQRNWKATKLMRAYNAKGIFSNAEDREEELREVLTSRFSDVALTRQEYAALFSVRNTPTIS